MGKKQYLSNMAENFLKLVNDVNPQIQKAQRILRRRNIKKATPDLTDLRLRPQHRYLC